MRQLRGQISSLASESATRKNDIDKLKKKLQLVSGGCTIADNALAWGPAAAAAADDDDDDDVATARALQDEKQQQGTHDAVMDANGAAAAALHVRCTVPSPADWVCQHSEHHAE